MFRGLLLLIVIVMRDQWEAGGGHRSLIIPQHSTVGMLGGLGGHKFEAYLGVSGAI